MWKEQPAIVGPAQEPSGCGCHVGLVNGRGGDEPTRSEAVDTQVRQRDALLFVEEERDG